MIAADLHQHLRPRRAVYHRHQLELRVDDALEYLELLCDPDPLLSLLRSEDWPAELEEPIAELTELVENLQTRDQMSAAVEKLRPRLHRWSRMARGGSEPGRVARCG